MSDEWYNTSNSAYNSALAATQTPFSLLFDIGVALWRARKEAKESPVEQTVQPVTPVTVVEPHVQPQPEYEILTRSPRKYDL